MSIIKVIIKLNKHLCSTVPCEACGTDKDAHNALKKLPFSGHSLEVDSSPYKTDSGQGCTRLITQLRKWAMLTKRQPGFYDIELGLQEQTRFWLSEKIPGGRNSTGKARHNRQKTGHENIVSDSTSIRRVPESPNGAVSLHPNVSLVIAVSLLWLIHDTTLPLNHPLASPPKWLRK